jgi:tRNA-dihydrouridine synthase
MLLARGALGNPWIFRRIADRLAGQDSAEVTDAERHRVILEHADLHERHHGDLITFRKHLVWYFKGRRGAKAMRLRLNDIRTMDDLRSALDEADAE